MAKKKNVPTKMSLSKHRKSGASQKSPRVRHLMKIEAERCEVKAPKSVCTFDSIKQLFGEGCVKCSK